MAEEQLTEEQKTKSELRGRFWSKVYPNAHDFNFTVRCAEYFTTYMNERIDLLILERASERKISKELKNFESLVEYMISTVVQSPGNPKVFSETTFHRALEKLQKKESTSKKTKQSKKTPKS